jgi:hypothetical protein
METRWQSPRSGSATLRGSPQRRLCQANLSRVPPRPLWGRRSHGGRPRLCFLCPICGGGLGEGAFYKPRHSEPVERPPRPEFARPARKLRPLPLPPKTGANALTAGGERREPHHMRWPCPGPGTVRTKAAVACAGNSAITSVGPASRWPDRIGRGGRLTGWPAVARPHKLWRDRLQDGSMLSCRDDIGQEESDECR